MNNYFMSGKLMHKASDHNTKRCEVEKWVFLPHSDFERLKANPYQEHEAITAARDLMYEDKNAYHCIMLLDEHGDDGLLIEAEGFDYPRLSMFVPDAALIYERYKTSEAELKLHDMIRDTVEKIAELAHIGKTDFTSADIIDMDEVESLVKNAIVQQLATRDDIKVAQNTDINIRYKGKELSTIIPKRRQDLAEDIKKSGINLPAEKLKLRSNANDQYLVGLYTNNPLDDLIIDRLCKNDNLFELNNLCKILDNIADQDVIIKTILYSDARCINGIKKLFADHFIEFSDKLVLNTNLEEKPACFDVKKCVIEKAIAVTHKNFENISRFPFMSVKFLLS